MYFFTIYANEVYSRFVLNLLNFLIFFNPYYKFVKIFIAWIFLTVAHTTGLYLGSCW